MARIINPQGLEHPFSAVGGMTVLVPEERRIALAGLAQPFSSFKKYAAYDLPVVVGALSEAQRREVAPQEGLDKILHWTSKLERFPSQPTRRDFLAAAEILTERPELQRLRSTVADILLFDRATFPDKLFSLQLHYIQDRPGPARNFAPEWHRHKTFREYPRDWSKLLAGGLPPRRDYTFRTTPPMEIIRDQIGLSREGRALMHNVHERRDTDPLSYNPWLQKIKAGGWYFQPEPHQVVLTSSNATTHKSFRPAEPVDSALMQLQFITEADRPTRKWWQGFSLTRQR